MAEPRRTRRDLTILPTPRLWNPRTPSPLEGRGRVHLAPLGRSDQFGPEDRRLPTVDGCLPVYRCSPQRVAEIMGRVKRLDSSIMMKFREAAAGLPRLRTFHPGVGGRPRSSNTR